MVRWAVKLSEFDIQYEPMGPIKGQVDSGGFQWVLSVDGSSNQQGSGAGIILEGPNKLLIEQALRFAFKANNN